MKPSRSRRNAAAIALAASTIAASSLSVDASGGTFVDVASRLESAGHAVAWDTTVCASSVAPGQPIPPVAYVEHVLLGVDLTPPEISSVVSALGDDALAGMESAEYGTTIFHLDPTTSTLAQLQNGEQQGLVDLALNHVFAFDPFWRFRPYSPPTLTSSGAAPTTTPIGEMARKVVVVDTGYPHDEGIPDYTVQPDSFTEVNPTSPTAFHGPFIASQIDALTSNSNIVLQRVLTETGVLPTTEDTSAEEIFDEVALINSLAAADLTDAVVNLSLGTYGCEGQDQPEALYAALDEEIKNGAVFVASAGNDETTADHFPAQFSNDFPNKVISVGAHDGDAESPVRACFSNYGTVDVWAPGLDVHGIIPTDGGSPATASGTSFAAPYITAAIAANVDPGDATGAPLHRSVEHGSVPPEPGMTSC